MVSAGLTAIATAFLVVPIYSQSSNNLHSSKYKAVNIVSLTEIASNLRRSNLLAEANYQEFLHSIANGSLNSRSQLLSKLEEDLVKSALGSNERELTSVLIQFIVHPPGITAEMRSQLQTKLQQLQASGVLSDRVYNQLQADIAANRIQIDNLLYREAAWQMQVYEQLQPSTVEPILNSWHQVDIISQPNSTELMQALHNETISDRFEFFNYFNRAVVFDLSNNSANARQYFLQLHNAIAQMLTKTGIAEIKLDNLSLKTGLELDDEDHNAIISVWINGKQYQQGSYSSNQQNNHDILGIIDTDSSIELFNKILRDRSSPYRLYTDTAYTYRSGTIAVDSSRFAVYALTDEQAKVYFKRDEFSTDKTYTSDRVAEILKLFNQTGLFSHLKKEQIAVGEQRVRQRYIADSYQILEAFPNLVITFDWESGNIENPYAELTNEFASASKGAFAPTQVADGFDLDKESMEYSFILGEKRYITKLKINDDWLDPDFFHFITKVVADTATTGKFYPLYNRGDLFPDSNQYIFLTNEQQQVLESAGLIIIKPPN